MIHVVFCTDKNLAPYVDVVRRSILANTKEKVEFHVLTRGVGRMDGYHQTEMDNFDIGNVYLAKWVTVSTMDRLWIPTVLNLDKVVYIDIDVVVTGDIKELSEVETGECGLAARESIRNGFARTIEYCSKTKADVDTLSVIAGDHPSFNAGVLVMDLNKMRAQDSVNRTLEIVKSTGCNDQIALASYSAGRFARLSPDWNRWVGLDNMEGAKLIHYVGSRKPWNSKGLRFKEWDYFS
jgi:lipopolysaccharide biosynthesis glycosyltransferase